MNFLDKLAASIDAADHGYSIRLKTLTDEGSTYTLDLFDGNGLLTFDSHVDALDHAIRQRSLAGARAAALFIASEIEDISVEWLADGRAYAKTIAAVLVAESAISTSPDTPDTILSAGEEG